MSKTRTALSVLKGALDTIRGHFNQGQLVAKENRHDPTFCAMGAIMWQLTGTAVHDFGSRIQQGIKTNMETHVKWHEDSDPDPDCERFRYHTNAFAPTELPDGSVGREATVLLAEAMGFEMEGYDDSDLRDEYEYVSNAGSYVIGCNDGSRKVIDNDIADSVSITSFDAEIQIIAGFEAAIATLEAN